MLRDCGIDCRYCRGSRGVVTPSTSTSFKTKTRHKACTYRRTMSQLQTSRISTLPNNQYQHVPNHTLFPLLLLHPRPIDNSVALPLRRINAETSNLPNLCLPNRNRKAEAQRRSNVRIVFVRIIPTQTKASSSSPNPFLFSQTVHHLAPATQ